MYNFKEVETSVIDFWNTNKIYEKLKKRNIGKKKFYYLDGPPYTSGRAHLGHAWGKSLRDMVMRYKRMQGFDVWDRSGFDMHGLPTEHAVEKKLGIKHKEEIKKYGVLKYIEECEKLSVDNLKLMIADFKKLGVWMDWENPYMPINNSYIEGVWWLVKKAHERKRLYEGLRTMHWCSHCATALAKHELEYENITDKSVFLKFKVKDTKDEYLLIWTTTAWTIPFNMGIMVNPELEYVKCKVDNEYWVIAKLLANLVISGLLGKKFEIVKEFKGTELEGIKYEHPFQKDIKYFQELEKTNKKLHTVVLSEEYVDASAGTGLVHMAPGAGPEDYEVGHRNGIPPYNTLNEEGYFDETMGKFSGLRAKQDDKKFIEYFKEYGFLLESTAVEHEYAHCWRCHNPVVFRTTKQWFFKVENLKEKMKKINQKTYWVPDWAGSQQFHNWLDNLRDNSITKQRYWGTPLPVWKCEKCENYEVIGSIKDLQKHTKNIPKNLHKPWIDEVTLKCKCKGVMKRIPDVIDVWVDAGCASWLCLDYPARQDLLKKWYPADFIVEGKDQIRGWFNILLIASMLGFENTSYKSVYMHGFINDSQGRKMSKSLKNYILPEEVLEKYGADTLRYYMVGGTKPGVDINYNFEDMKVKFRNLGILSNLMNYVLNLADQNGFNSKTKPKTFEVEEKYALSMLNSTIRKTTKLCDKYNLDQIPWVIESGFLNLSRSYVQFTRDKSSTGTEEEKKQVFYVCYNSLLELLKMFSIISPFISEYLYQKLKEKFNLKEESITYYKWPKFDTKKINEELEESVVLAKQVIESGMAVREKSGINVRWPLKEAVVYLYDSLPSGKQDTKLFTKQLKSVSDIIQNQLNIKDILFKTKKKETEEKVFGQFSVGEVELNITLTPELECEGYTRELMRRIQALRKTAGLQKQNEIELYINFDLDLKSQEKIIKERCGAKKVYFAKSSELEHKYSGEIKGKKFELGFNLV